MKSFRIRDALADSSWGIESDGIIHPAFVQCVYFVREEEDIFYVGMTESDFGSRFRWHLAIEGRGSYRLSPLGECIIANWPASLAWKIELWKPEEIQQEIVPPELRSIHPFGLREAERYVIRHFRPPAELRLPSVSRRIETSTSLRRASMKKGPNKAPEPTPGAVTPRATSGKSK